MMAKTHLKIEGMTCQHCVSHVTEALEAVLGVTSAKVNLKKGEAVVKSEDTSLEQLSAAVSSAGYQVV
ncbi:mercuric reductase [Bacilli bacterium]|nr:mercuric reductase [Bacilli bacterium]GHU44438.1 mercuric reductase [Bacilli bacterium]GHU46130.1 mercuric reductase [Bacilli bacterium]